MKPALKGVQRPRTTACQYLDIAILKIPGMACDCKAFRFTTGAVAEPDSLNPSLDNELPSLAQSRAA